MTLLRCLVTGNRLGYACGQRPRAGADKNVLIVSGEHGDATARLETAASTALSASRRRRWSVEDHQILRRSLAVTPRHQLVLHLLALAQGAQAGALHRRDVD